MTSEVVLAISRAAPYCSAALLTKKANARLAIKIIAMGALPAINVGLLTICCDMPNSAAALAIKAPPPNMANMREPVGACRALRSNTLVTAKLKPPMIASQSAPPCGIGHGDSGVLSTISTPVMASAKRNSEASEGFSPSISQATSTDQAGIR